MRGRPLVFRRHETAFARLPLSSLSARGSPSKASALFLERLRDDDHVVSRESIKTSYRTLTPSGSEALYSSWWLRCLMGVSRSLAWNITHRPRISSNVALKLLKFLFCEDPLSERPMI